MLFLQLFSTMKVHGYLVTYLGFFAWLSISVISHFTLFRVVAIVTNFNSIIEMTSYLHFLWFLKDIIVLEKTDFSFLDENALRLL